MAGTNEIRVATLGLGIDPAGAKQGAKVWGQVNKNVRDEASKTAADTQKSFNSLNFNSALRKIAALAAAYIGIRQVFRVVNLASEAEQIQLRLSAVFGKSAAEITQWADQYAQAMGRSSGDIQDFVTKAQGMLAPLGIQKDQAAKLSKAMVTLGTDIATFNNVADEGVMDALIAAMAGSERGLRQYGIVISSTQQKQEALNMGITRGMDDLTDAEKVIINYSLVQKALTAIQNEGIQAQDTYARQTKKMKDNLKDIGETVGKALLPAFTFAAQTINAAMEGSAETINRWSAKVGAYIKYAVEVIRSFATFMKEDWRAASSAGLDLSLLKFEEWGRKLLAIIDKVITQVTTNVPVMMKRAVARWKLEETITSQVTKQIEASARTMSDKVLAAQFNISDTSILEEKSGAGGQSRTRRDILKDLWSQGQIEKTVATEMDKANAMIEQKNPFKSGQFFSGLSTELAGISADMEVERQKIIEQVSQTAAGSEFVTKLNEAKARLDTELASAEMIGAGTAEGGTAAMAANLESAVLSAGQLSAIMKTVGDTTVKAAEEQKTNLELSKGIAQSIGGAFNTSIQGAIDGTLDLRQVFSDMFRDIASQLLQQLVIKQIVNAVGGGLFGMMGGGAAAGAANGGLISNGHLYPMARGGILNSPAIFPMANGGIGLAGEKGPEAVMPLSRNSDGKLGVASSSPEIKVNIVNVSNRADIAALMASSEGQKIIMNTLQNNKRAARQLIA